jgi:two-component system response regulator FixJ
MPGTSGLELLELLRACGNSMPVIVFSGHGDKAFGESAIRAGAMAMLDKPVDDVQFIKLVEQALSGAAIP